MRALRTLSRLPPAMSTQLRATRVTTPLIQSNLGMVGNPALMSKRGVKSRQWRPDYDKHLSIAEAEQLEPWWMDYINSGIVFTVAFLVTWCVVQGCIYGLVGCYKQRQQALAGEREMVRRKKRAQELGLKWVDPYAAYEARHKNLYFQGSNRGYFSRWTPEYDHREAVMSTYVKK